MFTGIVEEVGQVLAVRTSEAGVELKVEAKLVEGLEVGASVAVNGACLTIVAVAPRVFTVEVVRETLERTTLGGLAAGDGVNLERAARLGEPLDGHLVQGHVDGLGTVSETLAVGDGRRLQVALPERLRPYLAEKGSVAVDGVSLTVARLAPEGFQVALIPHTLQETTLGTLQEGSLVNVEVDVVAKYVERLLEVRR
ncbi:MAG: riboflavin synthase [Actinomycetota bacterium]|nr:riboflavin synthase [Actinomycetota bacterium]